MVIVLPSTDRVAEQLKRNGNSVTFLQVAMGLLKILDGDLKAKGLDWKQDLEFIRSCLRRGRKHTNVPCALAQKNLSFTGLNSNCSAKKSDISQETRLQLRRSFTAPIQSAQPQDGIEDADSDCSEDSQAFSSQNTVVTSHSTVRTSPNTKKSSVCTSLATVNAGAKRKDFIYRGALCAIHRSSKDDGNHLSEILANGCPWMGPAIPAWPTDRFDGISIEEVRAQFDDQFHSWFFDIFEASRLTNKRPLTFIGWEALLRCGMFSNFNIDPEKSRIFLQVAESKYVDEEATAYHNNIHAADVTQTVWAMLQDLRYSIYFDAMDTAGLIISAIIHDMGHDGKNNAYHTKALDHLAMRYNDRSVLENYHLACAFELLMMNPSTNLLRGVLAEQRTLFRKEIIDMVLGTDMGQHFAKLTEFSILVAKHGDDQTKWQSDEASISALRGMLLHCADISNPTKNMKIAQQWAARCLREFFTQGDIEKRMNIPVSPLCDRVTTNVAESQTGFIQFIVQPTFASFTQLSAVAASIVMEEIARNELSWQTRRGQDFDIDTLSSLAGLRSILGDVPTVLPDERILDPILVQSIRINQKGSSIKRSSEYIPLPYFLRGEPGTSPLEVN